MIVCGDWNIAHTEADIWNPKGNKKNSGFLPEERERLDVWAAAGKIGLEVVENAGHWVHAEQPARVLAALVGATG